MKKVVLDDYIRENKAAFTKNRLRMEKMRSPLPRKRDEEEKAVLLKLDRARWERWLANGRIQIVGERRFKIRLGD